MQEQLQTRFGDWQQARGPPHPPLAAAEGPRAEEKGLSGSLSSQTGDSCRVFAGRCYQRHLSPGRRRISHVYISFTHFSKG